MKKVIFLFLLGVMFFDVVCQASDEQRIDHLLRQREEAFLKKDLSLYLSCISPSYQDKEEDFDRIKSRIERYFKMFDRITYSSWDRSIHIEREDAQAVHQFHLEVEREGKKNSFSGKEALTLRKEKGSWKIIRGL
jgi:hypothetical protein